ncbi:MAG: helicase-related protein [Polyangiales bacterium]
MSNDLPVCALRAPFLAALASGPVVLTSPTGSGKSTEVPRWCAGPVLVVEPRRIACRSLAARVAQLEDTRLGQGVGYVVRDEHVASPASRIVFVTPGILLRNRSLLATARTVILDEFHERSLDTDLLLALLLRRREASLVIMSATMEAERVARHIGGVHLTAEGRAFPVEVRHRPGRTRLPDVAELAPRVADAVAEALGDPGDILVFLPGKAEIEACAQAIRGPYTLVPLHGGLTLGEQRRAFESTPQRKVILATNVAETSLTIPGVGVVIDSGLVRQTIYQAGRGSLALTPIAQDSAAQRAGRAGRTAAGVCYRLWSMGADLPALTLPEIHRESLVPLVLTAAAWGEAVEALPLLDAPKPYALEAARSDLIAWGALVGDTALSESGRGLFALPIDPRHARLLIAARAHGCLEDMIDLVSVLSVGRPLFLPGERDLGLAEDLRLAGCDASAAIHALRAPDASAHGVSAFVVREARAARTRLRRAEGLPESSIAPRPVARDALVQAAVAADPRLAHVARPRGRTLYFSNGGTEIELARESAAHHLRSIDAILALDTRALGAGRDARVLVTCAMAVPLSVLTRAGLGEDRLASVRLERKRIIASIERVFANRVLAEREETPEGALARAAITELLLRGSLFRDAVATTRERLTRAALVAWLALRNRSSGGETADDAPTPEAWLRAKVDSLGIETGDDLALLSASDFLAPEVPFEALSALESDYPLTVSTGDATYRAEYQLAQNQVTLHLLKGTRVDPPPLSYLPKFPGLRICVETRRGQTVLRARG